MRRLSAVVALAAALALPGCATMAHGTRQDVIINSEPPGARVTIDGTGIGVTPFVHNFWRGARNVVLRFELDGYEAQDVKMKRDASGWVAGDFAVALNPMRMQGMDNASAGTYLGSSAMILAWTFGTDLITGGGYKFDKRVTATLRKLAPDRAPR